ncbi:MAG: hypothetical protein ACR2LI_13240 [Propionibacteriaceae bacterium]
MTPLVAVAIVVTVLIVLVWGGRTVAAERAAGRGQAQPVRRPRPVQLLDVILWVLGVAWAALLSTYFTLSLMGA